MPNDTKFIGLQSVQIANCEEMENWPKYNDLSMSRKKMTQLFSIITVTKTCKLAKTARAVDEGLRGMSSGSNLDTV